MENDEWQMAEILQQPLPYDMTSHSPVQAPTVLVTGAGGYIGSVLVRELLEAGHQVRGFDLMLFGPEVLNALQGKEGFELVAGDLRKLGDFPHLFKGVDTVIHLASLSNDPSCEIREDLTRAINTEGTRDLAERARDAGVRQFIFCSSCSVYGEGGEDEVNETSPLHPVSAYAQSKVDGEKILQLLRSKTFHPVILRNATVFGASPRMRFDLAINVMTLHALVNQKIVVYGGGRQWRPLVHVRDVTNAIKLCLQKPPEELSGRVFNVGTSENNVQIVDLAKRVKGVLPETEVKIAESDEPDKRSYRVNFDTIGKALGYEPRFSIEDGILEVAALIRSKVLGDMKAPRYYNMATMKQYLTKPALEGGEPLREKFLPLAVPTLGKEEEDAVIATLRSGWITTGPRVKQFEQDIAAYLGTPNVLAVSSCTAALHLALVGAGIGPGDEVIVPPITFPSTANVVVHTGATPVFVDVEPDTLNINPDLLRAAITPQTKAIIPVDMAGQPCALDVIAEIAREHNLFILEDAAHAIGASFQGQKIGTISDFTAFSFYPIKNMTTIEGGVLTFKDDAMRGRLSELALFGLSRDAWKRYGKEGDLHWDLTSAGFKYNMTDVEAAVGIEQLKKLPGFLERRKELVAHYRELMADLPEFELVAERPGLESSNHLFIVRLRPEQFTVDRDTIARALKAENIGIGFHFRSLHLLTYYRERYGFQPEDFPVANDISQRIISLPLMASMTGEDVEAVVAVLKKLTAWYRNKEKS